MGEEGPWVLKALFIAALAGILIVVWRITTGAPTPNEALLLSVTLTILSIIGSWIASRYYSEASFNKNMRVFALKAAEKVMNLSNELDRLSIFLQQELKETDYDSTSEALLAKNMRIESAIHNITTLKSINDRSLSDWQGVIGDEISAQREDQEEREESLRELVERLESFSTPGLVSASEEQDEETERLRSEVESIRNEMRFLATQVRGLPIRQAKKLRRRREVTNNCPNCGKIVQYKQTLKPTSIKALPCDNCGSRLYSRVTNDRFVLDLRTPIVEKVHCPGCDQEIAVKLDPVPGSVQEFQCITCQMDLSAIRQPKGVRVKFGGQTKGPPPAPTITDKLLKSIADAMGQQPWPTGKAKAVAKQLNISSTTVHRAIRELIKRDVFKLQSGGKLYVPTPDD